ncbi:16S rRNA (cytidine(1402)-2'-O)-methyltransferase [Fundicoccus culcitae]|uniref:Ribosomal RNA small subunit methyltransferase I n=1 Tax=Fundicoccus culcitae TaxID=2969821 RepID=A0ABY5P375_9LACT|nr:16S rRNA (cytidine(1402)-2'-O)-methyltransferase [Fundicoccus culcitae]UUX33147.1 16S rRNA (cytidine(1402)-2'-O)-methyltransferase [Fundicoccus culcitae]
MQKQSSYRQSGGCLYLVPTPIGNLEDITLRALRLLKEVDYILAEDTRQTIKLLNHFEITTKLYSFHEHSRQEEVERHIENLAAGQTIALVSDAGMPLINDPGHPLVQAALSRDLLVVGLPGANAALTALITSGLSAERFTYYGFFPRQTKEQQALLALVGEREETAIFYESPYRLKQTLAAMAKVFRLDTPIVVAREISKQYEEYLRGSLEELYAYFQNHTVKGEIVLLVEGLAKARAEDAASISALPLKEQVERVMEEHHLSPKEAIKQVAKTQGLRKQDVYQAYHGE